MRCLFCNSETKVIDSRESFSSVRRRRQCFKCNKRFTTYERCEIPEIVVIKNDGREELFDRSKLLRGIFKACRERNIPMHQIEDISVRIERKLRSLNISKIESHIIGDAVLDELKQLDKVAFARFASVYQGFEDIVTVKEV